MSDPRETLRKWLEDVEDVYDGLAGNRGHDEFDNVADDVTKAIATLCRSWGHVQCSVNADPLNDCCLHCGERWTTCEADEATWVAEGYSRQ